MKTPATQTVNTSTHGTASTSLASRKNHAVNNAGGDAVFALLLQAADQTTNTLTPAMDALDNRGNPADQAQDRDPPDQAATPGADAVTPGLLQTLLGQTPATVQLPTTPDTTETAVNDDFVKDKKGGMSTLGKDGAVSGTGPAAGLTQDSHLDKALPQALQAADKTQADTTASPAASAAPSPPQPAAATTLKNLAHLASSRGDATAAVATAEEPPVALREAAGRESHHERGSNRQDERSGHADAAGAAWSSSDASTPSTDNTYAATAADLAGQTPDTQSGTGEDVQFWSDNHLKRASLHLKEDDGSTLGVDLTLDKGDAAVNFHSDNPDLREAIQQGAEAALGDMLKDSGLTLSGLSVGTRQPSSDQRGTDTLVSQRRLRLENTPDEPQPMATWERSGGKDAGRALDVYA